MMENLTTRGEVQVQVFCCSKVEVVECGWVLLVKVGLVDKVEEYFVCFFGDQQYRDEIVWFGQHMQVHLQCIDVVMGDYYFGWIDYYVGIVHVDCYLVA